jgi:Transglutaminase-like superfamily
MRPARLIRLLKRPPNVHDARAAWWAWRALRDTRAQLKAGAVRNVRVPAAPPLPQSAGRAVRLVLSREDPSCLERSLVLQRWLLAHGVARDVVIGTSGNASKEFTAHAWLDGEGVPADAPVYVEMMRLAP